MAARGEARPSDLLALAGKRSDGKDTLATWFPRGNPQASTRAAEGSTWSWLGWTYNFAFAEKVVQKAEVAVRV